LESAGSGRESGESGKGTLKEEQLRVARNLDVNLIRDSGKMGSLNTEKGKKHMV